MTELVRQENLAVSEEIVQKLARFSKFNKSESTRKTHFYSLYDFCKFLSSKMSINLTEDKTNDVTKLLHLFCNLNALEAKLFVAEYLQILEEAGQSTSTMATKLSAIKDHLSFQKGILGKPEWDLDFIKSPKVENKKVEGPSEEEFHILLSKIEDLENSSKYIDKRNSLLCFILAFTGLRISEALSIDIETIDFKKSSILIDRKGKRLKQEFYLGDKILEKIKNFILENKQFSGPLFINQDKSQKSADNRLTRQSAHRCIVEIGKSIGIENLHPHKFRHFATTEALEVNNYNVHQTAKFTGHVSKEMVARYEDARKNEQLITSKLIEDKWLNKN